MERAKLEMLVAEQLAVQGAAQLQQEAAASKSEQTFQFKEQQRLNTTEAIAHRAEVRRQRVASEAERLLRHRQLQQDTN